GGRRDWLFPELVDQAREIHRSKTFESPEEAREWVARIYCRDRTEGQERQLYIAAEKATMVAQLRQWFGGLGVPIVALRGYASQTYIDEIKKDMDHEEFDNERSSVVIYAGDF